MFTKLGIDWKLFAAQLVNFIILFLVLRYFVWNILVKTLEERRKRIAQGAQDAKRAAERLKEIERERAETLAQTRQTAQKIMEQAEAKAQELKDEKLRLAKAEIDQQINEAQKLVEAERAATFASLKRDVGHMIAAATGKIVGQMDEAAHERLIENAIADLERAA